ncbi:NAD(P)/FAD-dependent oxidoreductase [Brevibacillus marinus]|uniref:NAD(P)/FAD-dependent oxidoreductase n=1 Tax=Brevibacillus marinus TaxID=2496837 RepID=UPI000F83EB40|nr:NAD(P)/FAD-dependent oxidoreductase [Brevibacillus marinus]
MREVFDVTIIGGGPAGLYSAFYAGLREMSVKIIECQPKLGGKVNIYPEKVIWDVGGVPPITGKDFIDCIVQQGLTFNPTVLLNTKVDKLTKEGDLFVCETSTGDRHYSKTVIVAVGGGIINPKKLEVEGAERFEQTNLHYRVQRIRDFAGQSLLISGGGDAAIDWAWELSLVAKEITVVYRGDELSAHEAVVKKVQHANIPIYLHTTIQSLVPDETGTRIKEVVLYNEKTKQTSVMRPDHVLIHHGYERDQSFTYDDAIKPELVRNYFCKTLPTGESSVPGIYAAGDIAHYDGKVHLIAGAFQDAIHAVNCAKTYIEPKADKSGYVSSHNAIFESRNRALIAEAVKQAK